MKVLHLDTGREMRGGQWQASMLIERLAALGVEQVVLGREDSPFLERIASYHIDHRPVSLPAIRRCARWADVVHAHDSNSHTLAVLCGARPLVVSRRVVFRPASSWLGKLKYRRADRFIAISEFVATTLERSGVTRTAVDVVYDGVVLPPSHTPSGANGVVIPFSEDPLKKMALAARAAECAGVSATVSRDLRSDLPGARMMVYLTASEGLGSGALLAMAHGVPVIATRTGGLPEAVINGVTGILVRNDLDEVTAAIRRLWSDPDLSRRLGQNGRKAAEERFSIDHTVAQTLAVYQSVQNR